MKRKMMLFALGAWWNPPAAASVAKSLSFIVAASASEPMLKPVEPKKWRRVIRSSSLPFISLFLREGLIQIEKNVGQHHIGRRTRILEVGSELRQYVLDDSLLLLLREPRQDGIGFTGLWQAPSGEAKTVAD